ncbi:MAG: hypothetical protein ACRDHK_08970 [Actinomycetota bacterium]
MRSPAMVTFVDEHGIRHRWPVPSDAYRIVAIGDRLRIHARRGGLGLLFVRRAGTYWAVPPASGAQAPMLRSTTALEARGANAALADLVTDRRGAYAT